MFPFSINKTSLSWKIWHFAQNLKETKNEVLLIKSEKILTAKFFQAREITKLWSEFYFSHDLEKLWTFAKNVIFSMMMVNFIWHWMLISTFKLVKTWRRNSGKSRNCILVRMKFSLDQVLYVGTSWYLLVKYKIFVTKDGLKNSIKSLQKKSFQGLYFREIKNYYQALRRRFVIYRYTDKRYVTKGPLL